MFTRVGNEQGQGALSGVSQTRNLGQNFSKLIEGSRVYTLLKAQFPPSKFTVLCLMAMAISVITGKLFQKTIGVIVSPSPDSFFGKKFQICRLQYQYSNADSFQETWTSFDGQIPLERTYENGKLVKVKRVFDLNRGHSLTDEGEFMNGKLVKGKSIFSSEAGNTKVSEGEFMDEKLINGKNIDNWENGDSEISEGDFRDEKLVTGKRIYNWKDGGSEISEGDFRDGKLVTGKHTLNLKTGKSEISEGEFEDSKLMNGTKTSRRKILGTWSMSGPFSRLKNGEKISGALFG